MTHDDINALIREFEIAKEQETLCRGGGNRRWKSDQEQWLRIRAVRVDRLNQARTALFEALAKG